MVILVLKTKIHLTKQKKNVMKNMVNVIIVLKRNCLAVILDLSVVENLQVQLFAKVIFFFSSFLINLHLLFFISALSKEIWLWTSMYTSLWIRLWRMWWISGKNFTLWSQNKYALSWGYFCLFLLVFFKKQY